MKTQPRAVMQRQEKTFLIFFALFLLLGILAFSSQEMLKSAHAAVQYFTDGYSNGKLIVSIAWLSLLSIACFAALKFKINEKLEKFEKHFFAAFIIAASAIMILGVLQFNYFATGENPNVYYATYLKEGNYSNWEGSGISHSHFPKITLYFIEKSLGINLGNEFDDGKPLYNIFPNRDLWSAAFTILLAIMLASVILHSISKSRTISPFDFLVFALATLNLTIHGIDGGIGTGAVISGLFLITLYALRNYAKIDGFLKNLVPLALTATIAVLINSIIFSNLLDFSLATPLLLTLGLSYYFAFELIEKKIKEQIPLKIILALFLLVSANNFLITYNVFVDGKWVIDNSKDQQGDVLFMYGLPESSNAQELKQALEQYGEVKEFEKTGWVAYARIVPNGFLRTGIIQADLEKKLNPTGYFYVEEIMFQKTIVNFKVLLLKNKKPIVFEENFLGLKVLNQSYNSQENAIYLTVQSNYGSRWGMLSILTQANEQGLKEQVLLIKQ